jgi:hypothetical protein
VRPAGGASSEPDSNVSTTTAGTPIKTPRRHVTWFISSTISAAKPDTSQPKASRPLERRTACTNVVVSSLMIHHLPETLRPRALGDTFRLLRRGGSALIAEFRPRTSRRARSRTSGTPELALGLDGTGTGSRPPFLGAAPDSAASRRVVDEQNDDGSDDGPDDARGLQSTLVEVLVEQ